MGLGKRVNGNRRGGKGGKGGEGGGEGGGVRGGRLKKKGDGLMGGEEGGDLEERDLCLFIYLYHGYLMWGNWG